MAAMPITAFKNLPLTPKTNKKSELIVDRNDFLYHHRNLELNCPNLVVVGSAQ